MVVTPSEIRRHATSPAGIFAGVVLVVFLFGFFVGGIIGRWLVNVGRPNEGIAVHRLALMIDPWNAAARNDLGLTLLEEGDTAGAIHQLQKAVDLRPEVARYHHHLGFALLKHGDLDGAMQAFQEAVRLDPEHEDYRRDLEMAFVVGGHEPPPDASRGSK